jgi:microcystin-dependent protein
MKTLNRFILIVAFLLLTVNSTLLTLNAAVPHLLNYQGRLTDSSGKPLDGSYNLTFRIYDAETAGNLLWEEIWQGINIQKGIFSTMLGSVSNLDLSFDKPYWLEIKVNGEIMGPRQRLASSGYAYMAENVLSIPKGVIVMWSGKTTDIPSGWALCDGRNGTPDLRDRFVVGAGSTYPVGNTGGEATHTLTIAEMPAHTHSTFTHDLGGSINPTTVWSNQGSNKKTIANGAESSGGGQPHENRPPYYALAYIMKL